MYYNTKTYDCLGKINRKKIKQSILEIENRKLCNPDTN